VTRHARLVLGAVLLWACAVTGVSGWAIWAIDREGSAREVRICQTFDRFITALGVELGATHQQIEESRQRITVELEC
jgi:hypothetical protein